MKMLVFVLLLAAGSAAAEEAQSCGVCLLGTGDGSHSCLVVEQCEEQKVIEAIKYLAPFLQQAWASGKQQAHIQIKLDQAEILPADSLK